MNIFEIAEKFNLSVAKVKRMEKSGCLVATGSDGHPLAHLMRDSLSHKRPLSVEQLLVLIQQPTVMAELRKKQQDARAQIAALGDFKAHKPAPGLFATIDGAAQFDEASQRKLIDWLKLILPPEPVPHAWIAVRVAQDVSEGDGRDKLLAQLTKALANIRKHEAFAGWSSVAFVAGQNRTFYSQPAQNFLDL